ncbi:methylated-DNA--[protein]-cysteine S-methyltransferase [Paenibacillus pasadenensis]|uniref:methylated-DNA--[protein]-cysteine S-methyltransferase n=1 Tax=Paenibacillus pasadenensis TaxID=217090 RepID=UPI0020409C9F|nr:methylated-DNA--[protein]-cysteine S-methyltransferase [Paenibacillus pasadenensis]MCM3746581.1 methylated-DNA--[protein]-cysteine S-methyltransferase [Paenibacillus pasadenensis]
MDNRQQLYWSLLETGDWRFYIAADENGLVFCGSLNGEFTELADWAAQRRPELQLEPSKEQLQPYADQLTQFLEGKRTSFNLPLALKGTSFQMKVWEALQNIPFGETRSYAELATAIGRPSAARAVGAAVGANPVLIPVPCHRVIGASGALTGYRGGMDMKTRLLALEQSQAE